MTEKYLAIMLSILVVTSALGAQKKPQAEALPGVVVKADADTEGASTPRARTPDGRSSFKLEIEVGGQYLTWAKDAGLDTTVNGSDVTEIAVYSRSRRIPPSIGVRGYQTSVALREPEMIAPAFTAAVRAQRQVSLELTPFHATIGLGKRRSATTIAVGEMGFGFPQLDKTISAGPWASAPNSES
jgi:hypothetical protein